MRTTLTSTKSTTSKPRILPHFIIKPNANPNGQSVLTEQKANDRSVKIGQYMHNIKPNANRFLHTYGGTSNPNFSAQKEASVKDHFGLLGDVNRHQYVARSTVLNPRQTNRTQSAQKYQKAKAFYPKEYYNRVGYQQSEASVVSGKSRTDALGQRVRQRFNEEIDYKEANGQTMPVNRLDRSAVSVMSGRYSNAGNSVRGSQASKAGTFVESSHKRPVSHCGTSTASRRMALRNALKERATEAEQITRKTAERLAQ
jgi:hypothetical protein